MDKGEVKILAKDWFVHNPSLYTDEENLRWSWLRAAEWGEWPLFVGQLVAPAMFLVMHWLQVAAGFVLLTWAWTLMRYRCVSLILVGFGPCVIIFKWPVSIGVGIYFLTKGDYALAAISGFWPVITLFLMWLTPPTKIGTIQTALMKKLGYEKLI